MSQATGTTGEQSQSHATLPVSLEFRDRVRAEKAKDGLSYEEYLRQHLPIETEE